MGDVPTDDVQVLRSGSEAVDEPPAEDEHRGCCRRPTFLAFFGSNSPLVGNLRFTASDRGGFGT